MNLATPGGTPSSSAVVAAATTTSLEMSEQQQLQQRRDGVTISWMPHTSLSQTSHVCLAIRSAHANLLYPLFLGGGGGDRGDDPSPSEWKVRASVRGFAGLELVPAIPCQTPSQPVMERWRRRQEARRRRKGGGSQEQEGDDDDDYDSRAHASSTTTAKESAMTSNPHCSQHHHRHVVGDDSGSPSSWFFRPTVARATHDCRWDALLKMPVRWRDLPRDAYLHFEILVQAQDSGMKTAYEATLPLFTEYGKLVTGLQKVELCKPPPRLSGGEVAANNPGVHSLEQMARLHRARRRIGRTTDPAASEGIQNEDDDDVEEDDDPVWEACCVLDRLERLEHQNRLFAKQLGQLSSASSEPAAFGKVPSVPWLDALSKARAEAVLQEFVASQELPLVLEEDEGKACLIVELPTFEIPIMHEESFYPTPQQGASGAVTPLDLALYRKEKKKMLLLPTTDAAFDPLQLVSFLDYENEHDNPVEDKYRALAHDLLRGLVDPALKPDRGQRDRLAAIIESTSHHLSREEKDLLWRFRFSLVDNRKALTKFLLAVDWTVDSEVVQAAELLEQWRKRSPIEVTDALKLLGKHVAFQTNLVRSYAIDTLGAAPDSELRLYLLQLVQALKYENATAEAPSSSSDPGSSKANHQVSSLGAFLIDRASKNVELANYLYWYLKVELDNPTHGMRYREVFASLETELSATPFVPPEHQTSSSIHSPLSSTKSLKSIVGSVSAKIGTPFRSDHGNDKDSHSPPDGKSRKSTSRTMWDVLVAQDAFISGLLRIQQACRSSRGKKDQKEEHLRLALDKEGYRSTANGSIPLPSAPDIYINGVNPESAKIFKSALYPALIDFHIDFRMKPTDESQKSSQLGASSYKAIVKTGDDLRQDQLVIMMIQLMDGLLKRAALDLCLTPYSILATSPTSGLVAFVEGSVPISQALSQHNNSILQFFQACAPKAGAKHDVRPEVLTTYLRSLAGYCVITYLLGVGDRHLDNILLRSTGHFFHIDFGFIFGRDPKPLPPAFRLTREMVDGLGGTESSEYRQFCSLACQAFNALRKSAGLVLNLLSLMSDAGIEDLSNNPLGDAEAVIAKVEERFRLDLTDEQAERFFIGLINDCLSALAPRVMDVFHSFAVSRR